MSMEPELTRVCGRLSQSLMVLGKKEYSLFRASGYFGQQIKDGRLVVVRRSDVTPEKRIDMLALWLKVVGIGCCVLWYLIWME